MRPVIISFYTNDWLYPEHAQRLRDECTQYGLDYYIAELPSTGEYKANTRLKPGFIRDCLHRFKEPIMWIDVDGYILKPFDIDLAEADIAACKMPTSVNRLYRVGTLIFNYTPAALSFVDAWAQHSTWGTDESAFDRAVKAGVGNTVIKELPIEYHRVKGKKTPFSAMPESTVICHTLSESESKLALKRAGKL